MNTLSQKYDKNNIGLYRDDGLAILKNVTGSQAERIKKDITKTFRSLDLKITIETNIKIANFLDVTLNLSNGKYQPFRKPNDHPLYINTKSNHPPVIIKHLHAAISKRISDISHDEEVFKNAAPTYEQALRESGFNERLTYTNNTESNRPRKRRQRNIIWFNPPFSKNVQTNIGKIFLKSIQKHFPKESKLHKIFNRNSVKISYSCMENMSSIIKNHNRKIAEKREDTTQKSCNCRKKDQCPLIGNCQSTCMIYKATVTTDTKDTKLYFGLTETSFKSRFANHKYSFNHKKHENSTELSKYIWNLKQKGQVYNIDWSIVTKATPYTNATKRCDLCVTEKLCIINADKNNLLNKRTELVSKCRHENKFYIMNFTRDPT